MKCEFCKTPISGESCMFASAQKTVNGMEHVFCCERCAEAFKKEREQ